MNMQKRNAGFSLIEVLISILIIAVGLLGLAGIQALIVSNTGVAKTRGVAAILAANLSAAMGANAAYWGSGSAPASTTVVGSLTASNCDTNWTATTLSDGTLSAYTTNCSSSVCATTAEMAAYDLKYWGCQLSTQLPSGNGKVECAATAGGPVACKISVIWSEKNAAYKQSNSLTSAEEYTQQTYQMVMQP